ncbi:MAG TPA: hypothetical protein VLE53_07745 [Gemmatimonadaceae bacterium]|nr:hypothetical protein [Gemmatimonadaceae bacterium]
MHTRVRSLVLVAAMAAAAMGAQCFSITDPFVVSVNIQDVTGTYAITPGTVNFDPSCRTENPADYLDANYDLLSGGRLVDITVQTIGQFGGTVNNGAVTINDTPLVTYGGSWNAFNTEQSLLSNSSLLNSNAAGVTELLDAVQNQQPITICHQGSFSQAAPAGLSVVVKVFAQMNATP